jgi:hypothetical protein
MLDEKCFGMTMLVRSLLMLGDAVAIQVRRDGASWKKEEKRRDGFESIDDTGGI